MNNTDRQLKKFFPRKKLTIKAQARIFARLLNSLAKEPVSGQSPSYPPIRWRPLAAALASLVIAVIIPGYAYANPQVTINHPLYPVKLGVEKIELALASSPTDKAEKLAKFSEQRLAEADVLQKEKPSSETNIGIKETVKAAAVLHEEAQLESADSEKASRQNQKYEQSLHELAQTIGINAAEDVVDTIAEALEKTKYPSMPARQAISNSRKYKIATGSRELIKASSTDEISDGMYPSATTTARSGIISDELYMARDRVESLKKSLPADDYEPQEVDALFRRLDKKLEQSAAALEDGKSQAATGLLRSTEALTNNAKHFIKSKDNQPAEDSIGNDGIKHTNNGNDSNDAREKSRVNESIRQGNGRSNNRNQ